MTDKLREKILGELSNYGSALMARKSWGTVAVDKAHTLKEESASIILELIKEAGYTRQPVPASGAEILGDGSCLDKPNPLLDGLIASQPELPAEKFELTGEIQAILIGSPHQDNPERLAEEIADRVEAVAIYLVSRDEELSFGEAKQLFNGYLQAAHQYGHSGDCILEPQPCPLCLVEKLRESAREIIKLFPAYEPVPLEVLGELDLGNIALDISVKDQWCLRGEDITDWMPVFQAISQATISYNQAKGQLYRVKE